MQIKPLPFRSKPRGLKINSTKWKNLRKSGKIRTNSNRPNGVKLCEESTSWRMNLMTRISRWIQSRDSSDPNSKRLKLMKPNKSSTRLSRREEKKVD